MHGLLFLARGARIFGVDRRQNNSIVLQIDVTQSGSDTSSRAWLFGAKSDAHAEEVNDLCVSGDGRALAAVDDAGELHVYDARHCAATTANAPQRSLVAMATTVAGGGSGAATWCVRPAGARDFIAGGFDSAVSKFSFAAASNALHLQSKYKIVEGLKKKKEKKN